MRFLRSARRIAIWSLPLVGLALLGALLIFIIYPAADVWFVWTVYRRYVATVAEATGLNSYLVTALALLCFYPFYRGVTLGDVLWGRDGDRGRVLLSWWMATMPEFSDPMIPWPLYSSCGLHPVESAVTIFCSKCLDRECANQLAFKFVATRPREVVVVARL